MNNKMPSRVELLDSLQAYFFGEIVEDPINGTVFDGAVLDALQELRNRFGKSADPASTRKNHVAEIEKNLAKCETLAKEIAGMTDKPFGCNLFIKAIELAQTALISVEFTPVGDDL